MDTPRDLVNTLKMLKDEYLRQRVSIIEKMATDATTLMKLRVIEKKVNAEGSIFGIYKRQKKVRVGRGNPSLINFVDTGRLMSGVGVASEGVVAKVTFVDDGRVIVTIEPHDDQDRIEVLGHLEDRFGNIVAWSENEQGLLIAIYESQFADLLTKFGF